ncbi:SDR family oxidoreductase [Aquimarina gracilis]|uniref:SDR family oxidoreductase n=1 Tax=Aquimarina gracilis TaxID=874422 RepID=A0ABU5ZQP0_9FLAO|nr:SDR family oxidoreductase [Aquimarina gracilis]MEB3344367.1 SDR family oxidoreductase [Aquimarina gracilis]
MSDLFSIQNKIIVITGATGILGSVIAKYLARQGAKIIPLGRNQLKVDSLVNEIKEEGGIAIPMLTDVTNEDQLNVVQQQLKKQFGKIDVLINAAGGNMSGAIITPDQTLLDSDTTSLKKVIELNYLGTFLPVKVLLPLFLNENKGIIVNFSSMSAQRPLTRVMGYSSAKAAIDNLTQWLAVEFCQKYGEGIRVNAIAPGFFLTEQNRTLLTQENGNLTERGQQIVDNTPIGRFGKPEELLGTLHWLSSEASKFVTGTIIPVDGGFNAYSGV